MHPQIMTLKETAVIGIEGQGPSGPGAAWIGALWQQAKERFGEVRGMAMPGENGAPRMLWGAMQAPDGTFRPWGSEGGRYLAGFEARTDAEPPQGWARWTLPAGRYLAVPCTQADYGEVFSRTLREEMPALGLRLAGAVQERYDLAEGKGAITLLFPVATA